MITVNIKNQIEPNTGDECKMCHSVENGHRSIALGYRVICDKCLPKLKLIANAAPELLEACKALVSNAVWDGKTREHGSANEYTVHRAVIEAAQRAIAKAEGRNEG